MGRIFIVFFYALGSDPKQGNRRTFRKIANRLVGHALQAQPDALRTMLLPSQAPHGPTAGSIANARHPVDGKAMVQNTVESA